MVIATAPTSSSGRTVRWPMATTAAPPMVAIAATPAAVRCGERARTVRARTTRRTRRRRSPRLGAPRSGRTPKGWVPARLATKLDGPDHEPPAGRGREQIEALVRPRRPVARPPGGRVADGHGACGGQPGKGEHRRDGPGWHEEGAQDQERGGLDPPASPSPVPRRDEWAPERYHHGRSEQQEDLEDRDLDGLPMPPARGPGPDQEAGKGRVDRLPMTPDFNVSVHHMSK